MGAVASGYLDSPITDKEVTDGVSKLGMSYGACSMQGWRSNNEDAMSCIPEFTDDSAMFAVYDGHGGPEIALYVAKYLPMLLKTHYAYKQGDTKHALREAFLAVDKQIVLEDTIDELQTLAGTKPDDEGDHEEKLEEMKDLHEEAALPLAALLAKYKQKMADCIAEEGAEMDAQFAGSGKGKKKVSNEDGENGGENGGAAAVEASAGAAAVEAAEDAEVEAKVETADAKVNGADAKVNGAGTSNGEATAGTEEDDEEDEDFQDGDEEESASETDDDSSESGSDSGSEDDEIAPSDEREGWGSGTTACVAIVKAGVITVANVGDSRCVVCTEGIAKDLSVDHKPEAPEETARVEKAGGKITKEGRVNGGLNLSRALGDHQYKTNADLLPEEQMISPLPDLVSHTITGGDEFMLVACDGIWNCMSSQEAIDFVKEHLTQARQSKECSKTWLSDISGKLMDSCMAADTLGDGCGCDNMTAVIVLLNQDTQSKRKLSDGDIAQSKKAKVC